MNKRWLLLWGLAGCELPHAGASQLPAHEVADATQHAFSQPVPGLGQEELARFFVGNSYFNQNWVSAPSSVSTRDGLGPLFNARSCSGCHFKDGRGQPPAARQPLRSMLVRISTCARDALGAPQPDPHYGTQLQGEAITGVAREAAITLAWTETPGQFADGEPYSLRSPTLELTALGYGPTAPDLQLSARVAPAIIGLGLLEAIPERELMARVDPEDKDHDGISGRANRVPARGSASSRLGRFGWKAEQASVLEQTAAAFVGDMGLTSRLFAQENHTSLQRECEGLASGGSPELTDQVLDSVVLYARTLAVPARRAHSPRGEALFEHAGCAHCHVPSWTTGAATPSVLGERTIHPYTDLLLHDLGPGLSDHRPSFAAQGAEWRTPPLWGIGLVERVNGHTQFLHDGRARNLGEAILWHDGEAARARHAYTTMSREDRQALLSFLESL